MTSAVEHLDALTDGDTLEALKALRRHVATNLLAAEPKELGGLSREYRAILGELEKRGVGREVSDLDEIAARRRQRRARKPAAAGS